MIRKSRAVAPNFEPTELGAKLMSLYGREHAARTAKAKARIVKQIEELGEEIRARPASCTVVDHCILDLHPSQTGK